MIQIGRFTFETWTAARAHLVSFTKRPLGTVFVGDDHELLEAALAMHSEAAIKIGPGVAKFTVERHPAHPNTQCVFVRRVDGTRVAVSFKNLGKAAPQVKREDRTRALREAIVKQILEFKDSMFPDEKFEWQCPITGELVTKSTCEVDHAPPATFKKLVEDWLTSEEMTLEDVDIHPPPHPKCELQSAILTESWRSYHRAHSLLRVVSKAGHKIVTAEAQKGGA